MGVARQTMKIASQLVEIAPKFEKSHLNLNDRTACCHRVPIAKRAHIVGTRAPVPRTRAHVLETRAPLPRTRAPPPKVAYPMPEQ